MLYGLYVREALIPSKPPGVANQSVKRNKCPHFLSISSYTLFCYFSFILSSLLAISQ